MLTFKKLAVHNWFFGRWVDGKLLILQKCCDISQWSRRRRYPDWHVDFYLTFDSFLVCPTGWILFNNNCYLINDSDSKTWLQAQTFCRSLKGELVKINSAEENDFVWDLVKRQATSVRYVWIGLKWNSTANGFYWYDHSVPVYNNWNTGEPNGRASEPCGLMYGPSSPPSHHGRWNDATCDPQFSGTACQRLL